MKKLYLIPLLTILITSANVKGSTFYWVGGTGNWSAYATHWATSSGGTVFHTQVPSSLDDVIFDGNSFSTSGQIVTIDQTIAFCKSMDWTGATNNPSLGCISGTTKLKVFGSFALSSNMNIPFNGILCFESLTPGNTITTFNKNLLCNVEFNGFGSDWMLQDAFSTNSTINLNFGTLKTNNKNLSCGTFYVNNGNVPSGLLLGTSTVTTQSSFYIINPSLVLDADSSYIKISNSELYTDMGTNSPKYNIIDFYSTSGSNQWIRTKNVHINKAIFRGTGGQILGPASGSIDSVFSIGTGDLEIRTNPLKFGFIQVTGDFIMQSCYSDTINKLVVTGNSFLGQTGVNYAVFGNAVFGSNLTIYPPFPSLNYYKFQNCTINGDASILSDTNYFDTLKLSIGHTYTFGSNLTQKIGKWFDCFGNPGFPIQLVANTFNQQATLNIGQNTFCSDYLYMRDMKGTGGPNLYVGANSNNVFNNSGWTFSNCSTEVPQFLTNKEVGIFPNPSDGSFKILLDKEPDSDDGFEIKSVYGEHVITSRIISEISNITIDCPNGLYFVLIKSHGKTSITKLTICR